MNAQTPTRRIVEDFPGYRIIAPLGSEVMHDADNEIDMPIIRNRQTYALRVPSKRYGYLWHIFTAGTVIDYAREYNEDPVEAVQTALKRGHKLRWFNKNPVTISNGGHGSKPDHIALDWGQTVFFDGVRLTLEKDYNDNIALIPA